MGDVYKRLYQRAKKMLSDKTANRMIDLKRFRDEFDLEYERGNLSEKQHNRLADMLEEMQK